MKEDRCSYLRIPSTLIAGSSIGCLLSSEQKARASATPQSQSVSISSLRPLTWFTLCSASCKWDDAKKINKVPQTFSVRPGDPATSGGQPSQPGWMGTDGSGRRPASSRMGK